jgi:hypothetical protein
MTRWKRTVDTLYTMHAHNRRSRWFDALLDAAAELDIPVCERPWENYDGSTTTDWIVPAGTRNRIRDAAENLHRRMMGVEA